MTPEESIEWLRRNLEFSVLMKKGKNNHPYFVDRLTTGINIDPLILRNLAIALLNHIPEPFTHIVTVESMGIPIGIMLSQLTDMPLTVIRKKRLLLSDDVVSRETGYCKDELYLPELISNGDEDFLLVDNIVDTGGTFIALQKIIQPACSAVLVCHVHAHLPHLVYRLVDYMIEDNEMVLVR